MKIDNEVELRFTYLTNELEDPSYGQQRWSISQSDAIDFECLIAIAGDSNDVCSRFARSNRDARVRKALANRLECRQAQYDVAKLAEVDNQNVAGIELHAYLFWWRLLFVVSVDDAA